MLQETQINAKDSSRETIQGTFYQKPPIIDAWNCQHFYQVQHHTAPSNSPLFAIYSSSPRLRYRSNLYD
jgi:hypothetical protein